MQKYQHHGQQDLAPWLHWPKALMSMWVAVYFVLLVSVSPGFYLYDSGFLA